MNCPYCSEQISDTAIVCKHCHRDLYIIRPLMEKLAEATQRLEALEAANPGKPAAIARAAMPPPASFPPAITPVSAMALAFIVLVSVHFIIIVEYDLPLILLRIVSIIVPLAFGFLCRESGHRTPVVEFVYGLAIAIASIFAMSAIVGKVDNVPVLPRNVYEWREFAEYGASITFGFFTGVIIRRTMIAMRAAAAMQDRLSAAMLRAVARMSGGRLSQVDVKRVEPIFRTVAALASMIVSITTGLRQFL
jgi:hypothetical protein